MRNQIMRSFFTLYENFEEEEFSVDDAKRVLPISYVDKMLHDLVERKLITRMEHSYYRVTSMDRIMAEWVFPSLESRMNDLISPESINRPLNESDTLFFIDNLKDVEYVAVSPTATCFYTEWNHFSVETVIVAPNEETKNIIEERVREFNKPLMFWIDVVDDETIYRDRREFHLKNYSYFAPNLEDSILLYLDYLKKLWLLEPRDVYYMMKSLDEEKRNCVIEKSKERRTDVLLEKIMSWNESDRVIVSLDELRRL